jgi:hypothetical protein
VWARGGLPLVAREYAARQFRLNLISMTFAAMALRMIWAAPCSLLGLALGTAVLAIGGSARRVGRTLEIAVRHADCPSDSALARLPFAAITFGHVILGVSHEELARLRTHERVHVEQYERLGPVFLLAYPCSSLVAALQGKRPYQENHFEVQAFREAAERHSAQPQFD